MSYILDALKKSQRQRELGQVPTLGTEHGSAPATRRGVAPWLMASVVTTLAALLAGLFVAFGLQPAPLTAPPADTIQSAVPVPAAEPATAAAAAPAPDTRDDGSADLEARIALLEERLLHATQPVASSPAEEAAAVALSPDSPAAGGSQAPSRSASVPLLAELPPELQRALPPLRLSVHVYTEAPEERFVFINSRRYRQGERTHEGAVVEEITPAGVILNHAGQRLRLRY